MIGMSSYFGADSATETNAQESQGGVCTVFLFSADSGQIPLFCPQIGHKYLHLQTVLALQRVVVEFAGHKNKTPLRKKTEAEKNQLGL
jgi:hypothetical protein